MTVVAHGDQVQQHFGINALVARVGEPASPAARRSPRTCRRRARDLSALHSPLFAREILATPRPEAVPVMHRAPPPSFLARSPARRIQDEATDFGLDPRVGSVIGWLSRHHRLTDTQATAAT
jgi:hypothetical protein